jgi:hypothetical protein
MKGRQNEGWKVLYVGRWKEDGRREGGREGEGGGGEGGRGREGGREGGGRELHAEILSYC